MSIEQRKLMMAVATPIIAQTVNDMFYGQGESADARREVTFQLSRQLNNYSVKAGPLDAWLRKAVERLAFDAMLLVAMPIIEQATAKLFQHYSEADRLDAQQEIAIQLRRRKVQKYDARRGPLTCWLWPVVKRLALDQLAKVAKRKPARPVHDDDVVCADHAAVDRFALKLTQNPKAHLMPKRAAQLADYMAAKSTDPANAIDALATQWGVSRNCADQRFHRLRESVAEMAIA